MNGTPSVRTSEAFQEAYTRLNTAQKQAVDTVEGPVLVVAGPGTGKTHILTLRIANILLRAPGTGPSNVLVLTFTDSAARTVRKRLASFVGEEVARNVGIYTFHSFAEMLFKKHPEAFAEYADQRLMGEVESVLLWREILENQDIKYLRSAKSPFTYLKDLQRLEDDFTRERITLADYTAWIDSRLEGIDTDEKFHYKNTTKYGNAGDMNPAGYAEIERLEKAREAGALMETFREKKRALGVYGYTDVLRIAVDTLEKDEGLRADLQEEYQYVLADEHQDANALQHALLDALAFDEYPNLFIVGDEKQAIYRFQGADSTHFATFLKLYPRAVIIPLTENYRSYQGILDLSHTLLTDLPSSTGEHVELSAWRSTGANAGQKENNAEAKLGLLVADDPLAERDQVAQLVEKAIAEGVAPEEIAIIALRNATADVFATHLRARGIPTLRAGDVDLEGRPAVRLLLSLISAIADPSQTAALRDALLAPWWTEEPKSGSLPITLQIPLAQRAEFLRRYRDHELIDALRTTFPHVSTIITKLQNDATATPPLQLLSRILAETGARDYFLASGDRLEDIPLIRQIIMHIEDMVARSPDSTLAEVMDIFSKAREHGLGSIKTSITQRTGHVTVITAHKAKGMEFERVFVVSLTAREWEKGGMSAKIPSPLAGTREREDLIRLLYVAMTRAKDELTLSYPGYAADGKEIAPTELLPLSVPAVTHAFDTDSQIPLFHTITDAPKLICELTHAYLEHDGLSPSAFNEYLESPANFFAKRVLRLREPESPAIAIGNAVHAGVAGYLRPSTARAVQEAEGKVLSEEERVSIAFAEMTRSLNRSLLPRNAAFDQLAKHARSCLESYLSSELLTRTPVAVEETFSVKRTVDGKEVTLKGKTDAVFKTENGECIVDFKTTSNILKSDAEMYQRQLAFYDLLLRANEHDTTSAMIIQIGEEKIVEHDVVLNDETRAVFAATLDEVLHELITGKWREGEPSEYDAILSLFTDGG